MANKRFSDFDLKSPINDGDYLVGYRENGSAEYKATFKELQDSLPATFKYLGLDIKALSGNWQDTYTTVRSTSSDWESARSTVYGLSSDWNYAFDTATAYSLASSTFLTSETDSQTLSFNEGTKELFISNGNFVSLSALIDYETSFSQQSAKYEDISTVVVSNSASWSTTETLAKQLSSLETTVSSNSAINWNAIILQHQLDAVSGVYTTVQSVSSEQWINLHDVTHSELLHLKNNNKLNAGQHYRIVDFELKWWNQSVNDLTVKTGPIEPLIVLALSENKLAKEAYSQTYADEILHYDIEENTSKSWGELNGNVIIPDSKGWISRRINKTLNLDISWDWRNLTVNCCKADTSTIPVHNTSSTYNRLDVVKISSGRLIYSVKDNNNNPDVYDPTAWLPVSPFNESRTYYPTDESGPAFFTTNDMSLDVPWIQLPPLTSTRLQQPTFTSSVTDQGLLRLINCRNVTINGGNNNVIIGTDFRDNQIGTDFKKNLIRADFQNNTIKNGFSHNHVGEMFDSNSIGDDFQRNVVGNNFANNTIEDDMFSNNIGTFFTSNRCLKDFKYNVIGNSYFLNDIENSFYGNVVANNFNKNEIGNGFIFNSISNDFRRNEIHDSCLSFYNLLTSFHFYTDYHVDVFRNACNEVRLRYFNCVDQLVVTDVDHETPYPLIGTSVMSLPGIVVENINEKVVVYSNTYQDIIYIQPWDGITTQYTSTAVVVNGNERMTISHTTERIGQNFGYSINGGTPQVYGQLNGQTVYFII